MTTNKKKIVLTGGGTGGHAFPLIFIWEQIKNDYDFLYIGERNGKEEEIVKRAKIRYQGIWAGKWRRYFSLRNFIDLWRIPVGIWQSFWILRKWKPDLILAKGGYVSVPVVIAARLLKIKVISHESDAIMGLANRIIANYADKIAVAFPVGRYGNKFAKKMIWVGMPVRCWSYKQEDEPKLRKYFSIENDLPVLLVTGGSQGAVNVNKYVMKYLVEILKFCNVIHLTGKNDFERVKKWQEKLTDHKDRYLVYDFMFEDYEKAMVLCDLVISRAGSTLAEISNLAKPSILIPLPSSASNHQYYNAKSFEDVGASVMVEERDFDKINLAVLVSSLIDDEEGMEEMRAASATAMQTQGSARIVADLIESVLGGKNV